MPSKFISSPITIQPCNLGTGYFYRGECFAYVWAWPVFSHGWWMNLLVHANKSPQDLRKAAHAK